jgi:hypothetical protein
MRGEAKLAAHPLQQLLRIRLEAALVVIRQGDSLRHANRLPNLPGRQMRYALNQAFPSPLSGSILRSVPLQRLVDRPSAKNHGLGWNPLICRMGYHGHCGQPCFTCREHQALPERQDPFHT